MIIINLDTPVNVSGKVVERLAIDTPIRARHLLRAMADLDTSRTFAQKFMESVCGLPPGGLEELSIEDYAKVNDVLIPFMASFQRPGLAGHTGQQT